MTAGLATLPQYDASSRALPWNVLGGDLTTQHPDVETALVKTSLDYDVQTLPSGFLLPDGTWQESGDAFRQIVRPNPVGGGLMVIGQSGTRLTPIHNRDAFAVADTLVGDHGATIEGACDYRNGAVSCLVVGLGKIVLGDALDAVDLNLFIRNPHDGSGALSFSLTSFRPACTNAVHAALKNARQSWKISHTPNAAGRVDLANTAIIAALNYRDAFQVQAEAMIAQTMSDMEFDKIVSCLWPISETSGEKVTERRTAIREQVKAIRTDSPTLDGVRGTVWGAFNALTEYTQHYRPVRGGERARAEAQVDAANPYARRDAALWDRFSAMV